MDQLSALEQKFFQEIYSDPFQGFLRRHLEDQLFQISKIQDTQDSRKVKIYKEFFNRFGHHTSSSPTTREKKSKTEKMILLYINNKIEKRYQDWLQCKTTEDRIELLKKMLPVKIQQVVFENWMKTSKMGQEMLKRLKHLLNIKIDLHLEEGIDRFVAIIGKILKEYKTIYCLKWYWK